MQRKPTSSHSQPDASPRWLRVVELAVEAAKALAWPLLAVVVLVTFFDPINKMATGFAAKVEKANKVSFGSLSLEIAEKVRESGNPELATQVGQLNPSAIEQLLLTPRTGDVILMSTTSRSPSELGLPKKARMDSLVELSRQGLIDFGEPIEKFLREVRELPLNQDQSRNSDHDWYVVASGQDSALFRRMRDQRFRLTAKGRLASEAVIKAVTAQLSRGAT